ncbi:MAG: caspase family protein, partial [Microcoleaceae cyanobacterium]
SYADQPLRGCLTDLQLMKELLIHRFGFAKENIISLTDQQATRENILNTWQSLFKSPIQPDDLILLHFSGYGQRLSLSLPNSNLPKNLHGLIPVDRVNTSSLHTSVLPIFASDLYKEIPTSNIISVLDTSYDYPEKLSNWRSRSRPGIKTEILDPTIANLYGNPEPGQNNPMPAIILSACQKHQIAMEIDYSGFSAGLFTYTLTQTLWESLPATKILINFNRVSNRVVKLANPDQQPQLQINQINNDSLPNFIPLTAPAPAVITAIEDNGKTARLWLGGILPENLEYTSINSVFMPDLTNNLSNTVPSIQLTIKNRQGLTAKAHINYLATDIDIQILQPGTILRELVRIFPKSLQLKVALDESLAKIEKVDATSNFSAI